MVMGIIGILASVAYPTYQTSQIEVNEAAAKRWMLKAASVQHQYFMSNNGQGYASEVVFFGPIVSGADGCTRFGGLMPTPPDVCKHYNLRAYINAANVLPTTMQVNAYPKGDSIQRNGAGTGNLRLNHVGKKFDDCRGYRNDTCTEGW